MTNKTSKFVSDKIGLKSQNTQLILDAARKKGITVKVISRRFCLLKLTYKGKSLFIKGSAFPVNSQSAGFITNNKFLTKRVLRSHNIPTPKSWLVRTPKEAKRIILKKNLFPCVLKPAKGAHGFKVFANIESQKELETVLPLVFTEPGKKNVLIEEFIKGKDYRLLVIGNKISAVMERVAAHVVGNGKTNILKLIKKFNQNPLVGEKYEMAMCKIRVNGEAKRSLKKQGHKLTSIPKKGEIVFLAQNANISTGGIGKDVTDEVSGCLKRIAIRAAKAIGIAITGVDIIYDKASKQAYVLELNSCAAIDIHHYPVLGKPRNVANDIIEFLLKEKLAC
ncbi:MAG TPA: ATP-grasp domain-containing protein [Candidatus Bathyarchaeia archaeon]|nr:ATP-grasp domain-containing protein [Candidatus Bathyarchaeia archaeon]